MKINSNLYNENEGNTSESIQSSTPAATRGSSIRMPDWGNNDDLF